MRLDGVAINEAGFILPLLLYQTESIRFAGSSIHSNLFRFALQCVAVCCSVLQCVLCAMCRSVLHVWQRVAVCYSVLQLNT